MERLKSVPGSVWFVLIVCGAVLTVTNAHEGSGLGEFTYEEYDDEGPYQGGYQKEDFDSLEDLADYEDVLDPITDDDISYSGYDYEEPLDDDGVSLVSSVVATPATKSAPPQHVALGNDSYSEIKEMRPSSEADGQSTPMPEDNATISSPMPEDVTSCRDRQIAQDKHQGVGFDGLAATIGKFLKVLCAQILPTQPSFVSRNTNVIRMCCPRGESLISEHSKYVSCQKNPARLNLPQAIVALFYEDCIEDLEEHIHLGVRYGNPCPSEGGLVSFGQRSNDSLYIIQNGSLLVVYGINDYGVYDTYCLDYDRSDGTLVGYVCPSEVRVMMDLVQGQLFLLTICLIVAIPGLLVTALLYIIVPKLRDLHGKALALNCINFAVALLLECFFQYRNRGKRMLMDDMVLENYAEYFILATFFWLLVNCANNCFHAWYYVPARKQFNRREENLRFALYAAFAQLIPLWIILSYSTTPNGTPAIKHYLFIPIGVTLGLGLICLLATLLGLQRLKQSYYDCHEIRRRLLMAGRADELTNFVAVCGRKVNKVIYMSKYTIPLFVVMGTVQIIMGVTYYATYELPIFYDILFGFQGILMFVIFVCMPRPWDKIKAWFTSKDYCRWMCQTDEPSEEEQEPMKRQQVSAQMARMPRAFGAFVPVTISEPKEITRSKNPFTYLEEL
uniref:G-protein coupled receptors family 2 profile 2 domain-containing protein n=1 Tax=Anopheles culicifacies TaxID=139723 RepID=A0A182MQU0_9DIPT